MIRVSRREFLRVGDFLTLEESYSSFVDRYPTASAKRRNS